MASNRKTEIASRIMTCLRLESLAGRVGSACGKGKSAVRRYSSHYLRENSPDFIIDADCLAEEASIPVCCGWQKSREFEESVLLSAGGDFFEHSCIGRFWVIRPVEKQCLAVSAARMRADPGVFIGKSPGLDCRAASIVQTSSDDAAIDCGLP